MPEDDEPDGTSSVQDSIDTDSEDSDSDLDIPDELKNTVEYKELMSLKSLRQAKRSAKRVEHVGYQVCIWDSNPWPISVLSECYEVIKLGITYTNCLQIILFEWDILSLSKILFVILIVCALTNNFTNMITFYYYGYIYLHMQLSYSCILAMTSIIVVWWMQAGAYIRY